MVAASQNLSAKLTALAVIKGTCLDVSLNAPSSLSKVVVGPAEGVQGSGGGTDCEAAEQQPQPQRPQDNAASQCKESEEKVVVGKPREGAESDQSCAKSSAVSMSSSSSPSDRRGRMSAVPLPMARPPVRGFHLVDLHAVVRNSVEWRQSLPKVG